MRGMYQDLTVRCVGMRAYAVLMQRSRPAGVEQVRHSDDVTRNGGCISVSG